jgi:hypothetical protein
MICPNELAEQEFIRSEACLQRTEFFEISVSFSSTEDENGRETFIGD